MDHEKKDIKCIMPAGGGLHNKVRNEYRKLAQARYEECRDIYKNRSSVERVIGIIKNRCGDRDRAKEEELARVYVLARFVLCNM